MKYYIGADVGTSSLKLLLVDENGGIVKEASRDYPVHYPKPSWSEQNPLDWWDAFTSAVGEVIADIDAREVAGIGVAGQMHGLVILDSNDEVIRPAILWNDCRTDKETDYLNECIGKDKLAEWTSNIAFAGFTAPKILWVKNNEPENFKKISKIMLPKDYINYRLTGVHCTDMSDAAGMLLLDVKNRCYSKEMLDVCGISEEQMPRLYESYECVGTIKSEVASLLGLSQNVRVIAGAGDNAGASLGMGTVGDGECNISLGTSGTVFISTDSFKPLMNNAIHNFCHANGRYHLLACILSAASANKWFCENILSSTDFAGEQAEISEDMLGNTETLFLPYLMGERSPVNDPLASGAFLGLRPSTTRAEMLLSVLEGVAFAFRDCIDIATEAGIEITESTVCGGGAKSILWLRILSNVLNLKLLVPKSEQGVGYGAAVLAMEKPECIKKTEIKCELLPEAKLVLKYEAKYQKYKKIYPSLKAFFKG